MLQWFTKEAVDNKSIPLLELGSAACVHPQRYEPHRSVKFSHCSPVNMGTTCSCVTGFAKCHFGTSLSHSSAIDFHHLFMYFLVLHQGAEWNMSTC